MALALLDAVLLKGRPLDEALAGAPGLARLADNDRALARQMVMTVLRRMGQIDALLDALIDRPLPKSALAVSNVLRLGAAQIAFMRIPPHAAVNETVSLLPTGSAQRYRGLVNAVLRRLTREAEALRVDQDAARLNTPDWLWESWSAAYGEGQARAIAAAHLAEPPLDITTTGDAEVWAGRLDATVLPTGTLRRALAPVESLPGFADGGWWVQDAAAALPARALLSGLAPSGLTIADLCAAPGGKTAQLAASGADVTALDVSEQRLKRLSANLGRLGLSAKTVAADLKTWTPETPFEAVLLDAPCSGTGTLRRHPDIARNRIQADVTKLARLQSDLLTAAARHVRPGGRLVYAVCSLQPEEGPDVVARVLAAGEGAFARRPIGVDEIDGAAAFLTPEGDLRTLPYHWAESGGVDGFYACRLERLR